MTPEALTWWDAAPAMGVAALLLLAPGLLLSLVGGIRGVLAIGLAPLLSVGVVSVAAVGAAVAGLSFSWGVVAGCTASVVMLVWGVRRVVAVTGGSPTPAAGEGRALLLGLVGVLVGGGALAVGVARGIGAVTRWPQTFDAVFHLNAVRHVLTSGDGSALTLGTVASPERSVAFYPAGWHDVTALVASASGVGVPAAANAVSVVVAGLVWPLGCVALTRVAMGARPGVLASAGVLSAGVAASPVLLLSYGTLWPNALATALLPAALALTADLIGLGPDRAVPRWTGALLLLGGVAGLGLAHPNAVVSLLVVGSAAVVVGTWERSWRWRVGSLGSAAMVTWLVLWSPVFSATRASSWPMRETLAQAAGEWAALSPQRLPVPLLVAGLALIGCIVAWRSRSLHWLLALHVCAGALFVVVAGSDGTLSRLVSGAWWDDAFRLAALAGLAGVPLAAVGLDSLAGWLAVWLPGGRGARLVPVAVLGVIGVVVVGSGGLYVRDTASLVARWYAPDAMVDPEQAAFVADLGQWVPAGEGVVGNPWDGAALTGPLAGRDAVFPHLSGAWGADRDLVASSLNEAAERPRVCAALRRLDASYVLVGPATFWVGDPRRERYAGLDVAGHAGFQRVAGVDGMSLWRADVCRSDVVGRVGLEHTTGTS